MLFEGNYIFHDKKPIFSYCTRSLELLISNDTIGLNFSHKIIRESPFGTLNYFSEIDSVGMVLLYSMILCKITVQEIQVGEGPNG